MKKEVIKNGCFIFLLVIVGSFFGFLYENTLTLMKGSYALRQGLLYEPLIPVYGVGLLAFYMIYDHIDLKNCSKLGKLFIVFSVGFIMGGLVEYIFSYIQEMAFGTISWDYSYLTLNLGGRTSVLHSSIWGLMGVIFYELLMPVLKKFKESLNKDWIMSIVMVLTIIFTIDCLISTCACLRHTERKQNIEPTSVVDRFLDKHYPNEFIERVYNNAKETK